jgi:hypothetical protein
MTSPRPRPGLEEKIRTAGERHQAAVDAEQEANGKLDGLAMQRTDRERDQQQAQRSVEQSTETRRQLAPAVSAASALDQLRRQLPDLRLAVSESRRRVETLAGRKAELTEKLADMTEQARVHGHRRDDLAEALRAAGLTAITAGPVPGDDELTIRARLKAVGDTISDKAVDPGLHEEAAQARRQLANLGSKIDVRQLAEQYADTDGARHPVALERSIDQAVQREADARQEYGRAQAVAESATSQYRQRADDRSTDRTSPDVEGFPADREITAPADADRYAEQLDELANEMGECGAGRGASCPGGRRDRRDGDTGS